MIGGGFLAIDPGLSGAVALVTGDRVSVWDIPTMPVVISGKTRRRIDPKALQALANRLGRFGPGRATIEDVQGMTDDDGSRHSAFTFGFVTGRIAQALTAAGFEVDTLSPVTWKRVLGLFGKPKEASRQLAISLFPHDAQLFARKKDEGRAEAALIAYVARLRSCRR